MRAFEFKLKRKKIEFDRLPVKPTGKSEPVEHAILNLNLNLSGFHRFPTKLVRYTGTGPAGLTGPMGKLNPVRDA